LLVPLAGSFPRGGDAWVYYAHRLPNPYDTSYADYGFAYSPAFAQAIAPLTLLPWPIFLAAWTIPSFVALYRMAGPLTILILFVPVVPLELWYGNVNLLLAATIVLGFRWPHLWAFAALTKVTPAIGLLWFAARREWRPFLVAVGTTALITAVSAALSPTLWWDWFQLLASTPGVTNDIDAGPLLLRLPIAAALIVWGARTDRPWILPVAVVIAMPVIWLSSLTVLVAIIPLSRSRRPAGRRASDATLSNLT